jgi:Protein of unknown function (DUF3990)
MVKIGDIINRNTKLYHATTSNCVEPLFNGVNIEKSNLQTDFGQGYYLTTNLEQAKNWAFRKERDHNLTEMKLQHKGIKSFAELVKGVILVYHLDVERLCYLSNIIFNEPDLENWAEFVYRNRSENSMPPNYKLHNKDKKYDFVYGPLADSTNIIGLAEDVDNQDIGLREFWNKILKDEYIKNNYDQISLHSNEALETLIWKGVELPHALTRRKPKNKVH